MEKVIIWGSGKYYQYKARYLRENYHIVGIVSKDSKEKMIDGYPVISKELLQQYSYHKIIVMSDLHLFEIVQEILAMGISGEKIVLGVNLPPATGRDVTYISKEEQLEVTSDGTIIWNHYKVVNCQEDIEELKRLHTGTITEETIRNLPLKPLSYNFGVSRGGRSIARYYIDQFVEEHKDFIKGRVMEVGDARYSVLGGKAVEDLLILSLDDEKKEHYVKGNLETGEGLKEDYLDCFILTNVLSSLFDMQEAVKNIGRALKREGGKAIITVPGIASLYMVQYETYGQFWRFSPSGVTQLLQKYIPGAKIIVHEYGNVKTSAAFLYGMTVEDLTKEELEYRDSCYPMVIGICLER